MSLVRRTSMLARCEFGIVGRTRGVGRAGSAVAAAAYNACARLTDTSRAYDFSRKAAEHVGGCVLLPPGAPPALAEPGALWLAAEAAERRSDAQLARQMLISIPREIAPADRLAFACVIVAPYVEDRAGAQVDVHCPDAADGGEQPHAHVLLTLRRVTDAGLAPTKCREWNVAFREDGGRAERARVAERATAWLRAHGVTEPYDLRSLADRGEDRPPEPTAPRADWQRWTREGAVPEAAPASVAGTLAHRGRRSALARAESAAAAATDEVAALAAQVAASQKAEARAESGVTGGEARPPKGAYTPKTDPAPTPIPTDRTRGGWKTAAAAPAQRPDDYTACRDAWRAEQRKARPDPRAALRAQEKADRDRVFRATRPGVVRAAGLAQVAKRHAAARVAVRAAALAATWSAPPQRETLDAWIARQAAAGHPAARALHESRERTAAGRARRDPVGEATRRVAAWHAEARGVLAAAPPGAEDVRAQAAATSGRAAAKEKTARDAAAAARRAVREHARRRGVLGGLLVLGRSAVAEHRRLTAAAAAADRRVPYAVADRREEEAAVQQAAKAAELAAKAARHAWTTGAGAAAGDRLAALDVIARAARAGDAATVAAVLAGDERGAARASAVWQAAPQPAKAPARPVTERAAADPRTAALAALARAEAGAARDPARLATTRTATAAAVAGDAATIAAAAAGDTATAQRAAAEWQARQHAEAEAADKERRRRAEAARLAADRQGHAGPGR